MKYIKLIIYSIFLFAASAIPGLASARAIRGELAKIDEVHLMVLVCPRGKYPDEETSRLNDRLEQKTKEFLTLKKIKCLQYVTDGKQYSPTIDIEIKYDTLYGNENICYIHSHIQLRESAALKRLPGVVASHGAITWQDSEIVHSKINKVEDIVWIFIEGRLRRLIDEIEWATKWHRRPKLKR
jgi:hypothetical protein